MLTSMLFAPDDGSNLLPDPEWSLFLPPLLEALGPRWSPGDRGGGWNPSCELKSGVALLREAVSDAVGGRLPLDAGLGWRDREGSRVV